MNEQLLRRLRVETDSIRLRNEQMLEEIEAKRQKVLEMEIHAKQLLTDLNKSQDLLEALEDGA